MSTERAADRIGTHARGGRVPVAALAVLALLAGAVPPAAAAPIRVDAGTQVKSIRFSGARAIGEGRLRAQLETRDRGNLYFVRAALGQLPLVPSPAVRPFHPTGLQRDLIRLRRYYRESGFSESSVDYEVKSHPAANLITITFVIQEGPPTLIGSVAMVGPDGRTPVAVPAERRGSWKHIERSVRRMLGRRLDAESVQRRVRRIEDWWKDHGHPSVSVASEPVVDSLEHRADLRYVIRPGNPARFGELTIAGNPSLSERTIRRELPFREGDDWSQRALDDGRAELQQLDLVRTATFEVEAAAADSSAGGATEEGPVSVLPVNLSLYEARPRQIGGDFGYGSDAGLSSEARWAHRNFLGEARTLTLSAIAQTGTFAIVENPDVRYRGAVSLLQPYFFDRRLSGAMSPYVEHRDDNRDRSLEVGTHTTLVYRATTDRTVSLDYQIASRRVEEYRLTELSGGSIGFLGLLTAAAQGLLDSLGTTIRTSVVTLSGRFGNLDQPLNPRYGILLRPALQLTAPAGYASNEYGKIEVTANAFAPLSPRAQLTARFSTGHLFPFGHSLPGAGELPLLPLLELRDVMLTAGGSGDVRGWGNRMLGPKIPDIELRAVDDTVQIVADGYSPLGGFAKSTFSVELRLPFPGLGAQFGTHVFLDGGRVWTEDPRFDAQGDPDGAERWFYAAGGGVDLRTPVGPIRLSAGYKLNPGELDLVDAGDYLRAVLAGEPTDGLPRHPWRRWQLHLGIGSGF